MNALRAAREVRDRRGRGGDRHPHLRLRAQVGSRSVHFGALPAPHVGGASTFVVSIACCTHWPALAELNWMSSNDSNWLKSTVVIARSSAVGVQMSARAVCMASSVPSPVVDTALAAVNSASSAPMEPFADHGRHGSAQPTSTYPA